MFLEVGVLAENYVTFQASIWPVDRVVRFLMIQQKFRTLKLLLAMTHVALENHAVHRWKKVLVNLGVSVRGLLVVEFLGIQGRDHLLLSTGFFEL